MSARRLIELAGRWLPSAQRSDGQLVDETTLNVVRGTDGHPVVEPLMRGGHARITTASSIRCDYASAYGAMQPVEPIWLAGAKSIRFVAADASNLLSARAVGEALADLLEIVDVVLVRGGVATLGGLPFPYLAFHEFIETLLFWAGIIEVDVSAFEVGTVNIPDRYVFQPVERHIDLMLALLARDWATFVIALEHGFTDPVRTLHMRARSPGHAELFLANVRRMASREALA